jgi:hypothetical protein
MPDDFQPIDARIYGAEALTPRDPATPGVPPASAYAPPAAVPASTIVQGSSLLAEGAANRVAANREEASIMASVGAAMTQWLPAHAYEYLKTPEFAWDPEFKAGEFMRQTVPFRLDLTDEKFMLEAKSAEDAQHRMGVIESRNRAHEAMGDHSVASFLTGALDPTYLAIDMVSLGTARLLQGGRLAAGLTAAGLTAEAGLMEQKVTPTSNTQIVTMALAMGAASSVFYRAGKMEPTDPGFPAAELDATVQRLGRNEQVAGEVIVHADPAKPGLTTSRVAATGEGEAKVQYTAGGKGEGNAAQEYNPNLSLSASEQHTLYKDGRVFQVETVDDIAQHSYGARSGATVIDRDAKAVYLPGEDKVFLIKGNIKPGDDVKGIMLHEYGVHMNAERVLGTETLGKMLDRLEDMALAGNQRAKRAFETVPANTPQDLLREEALGYYVEANHAVFGDHIIGRMVAGVRAALRKSGLTGLKLSENDIMQLVRKAAKGGEKASKSSFDSTFPMAWHGSPVKGFDAMKTEFMGTGEGNQAFGWGHYVSSEKGVALDYRNKESVKRALNPEDGGLYRVKINATLDQFVDLDARVQSPTVAAAFTKLGVRDGVTGKSAYEWLARSMGSQKAASEALHAEGVAGNRYATGRTRLSGARSSNFVLFHDSAVDVAARYSKGAGQTLADAVKTVRSSKAVSQAIEWSWHKTMSGYSNKAREIADLIMDSPTNMGGNSAASMQRAVRADLAVHQYAYEDALLKAMGARGFGLFKRITATGKAVKVQQAIEKDVYKEMLRRDRFARDGITINHTGVDPAIKAMADNLDQMGARALQEMKAAGVAGADLVQESSGYITRRWDISKIEAIEAKLQMHGPLPAGALRTSFTDTIGIAIQRATGWDAEVAQDVAGAIYDRTKRKGMFQDAEFHAGLGEDTTGQLRNMLTAEGLTGQRLQRVLDVLEGAKDEAGKMPTMKARVDMHMDETMLLPDGSTVTIMDMLDTNVSAITERYLDTVSARAAMAKKGMASPTEVTAMRTQLAQSIPDLAKRGEAVKSFDEMLNVLQGLPVGEEMLSGIRNAQAVTQMVGLASSGLWQITEYSTIMAQYGATRVIGSMLKEMPFIRDMVKHEATSLREVLTRNTAQDTRLRPFINRMEDNFEIPMSDSVKLALTQAKQLVPYANAMKFIQHHQARTTANLIVDTLTRAVKGDAKAIKSLEEYGLESGSMVKVSGDVRAHGMDTAKWSDATWQEVRGPMTKMMDEAVLRARLGEMPQFAHTSTLGKFLFTFRSFVLAAHNKVLANTLKNGGYAGLGLLLMYQMPLTVMATATNTALSGKPADNLQDTVKKALGQVGAFGLFSELFGVITGNKQQFGSPGLIGVDRMYKAVGAAVSGNAGNTAAATLNAAPILSSILPLRAIGEALKDNKEE